MTMVVSSSNATAAVDGSSSSSQSPPAPAIQTPSVFSPNVGPPPSRSYSVTAPTELQRSVQRQHEQQQQQSITSSSSSSSSSSAENMPWWQNYYHMYHYHPPAGRKPTVFGPYLLLHTLGEGEFGKVKLGIQIESGREVAIKLIKKDHIDSSSRMTKVEREISVLRTVCHPYIVKLYDVIETEKYIGIILQCASGGELFEYILAHRYLKERDACRLFAQLISGVHYMHQKHIVHRDLKLENLLLDRDRNIIITDFGFANQFTSAKNDLMATSCGSPCYAAPELVVSEGMYVGSAVDIWSCGVILYAMLCGYLPFDDDPANPEGDNINLLYKYILNTQLAFPDYVSDDARDLLQKMLVPDPAKRCTMQIIMEHNWLRPHRDLFGKNAKDLEVQAIQQSDLPIHHQQRTTALATASPQQQQQQQKREGGTVQPTGPLFDDDHPPAEHAAQEISATSSDDDQDDDDDQTVPAAIQSMEVDSDDARVSKEDGKNNNPKSRDSSIMIMSVSPSSSDKQQQQQQQQNDGDEKSTAVTHMNDECNVKGTMTATDLASSAPDISALELPASMHTESSESTAEKVSDIPDPSNKSDTAVVVTGPAVSEQDVPAANAAAAAATAATTELPPPSSNSTAATANGSILQAKFLSSIQRQNNQQQSPEQPTPQPEQQSLMSMSTPQTPTTAAAAATITTRSNNKNNNIASSTPSHNNRRQRSPSSAISPQPFKHHHKHTHEDTENITTNNTRGTRRKALSLLVNSVTDHLQQHDASSSSGSRFYGNGNSSKKGAAAAMSFARNSNNNKTGTRERAQSVLASGSNGQQQQRYSGLKRVVVGKDRTTPSEAATDALPRSSMHVMPSVSEQTVIHDKDKHKSAGKKLMDWFKKKPLSTRHGPHYHHHHHGGGGDMLTDRPLSSLQRAMPLGKSYAVDFNDSKLRTHHGAVDQEALTSGSPVDVLVEVKQALLSMGIDVKKDGEYKLKGVRQRRKQQQRPSSQESSTTSSSSNSRTDKKRRMSTSAPFRKLLRRSGANQLANNNNNNTGAGGATTPTSCAAAAATAAAAAEFNNSTHDVTTTTTTTTTLTHQQVGETVYGDPVVDPGEEVRFSVELCKIKNLPGLYIVDIRRMRGNVWAYKFLYHTLLDTLNLSGKGGYIKTPTSAVNTTPPPQQQQQPGIATTASSSSSSSKRNSTNRHSCASSGGSSSMLEDVKEEE